MSTYRKIVLSISNRLHMLCICFFSLFLRNNSDIFCFCFCFVRLMLLWQMCVEHLCCLICINIDKLQIVLIFFNFVSLCSVYIKLMSHHIIHYYRIAFVSIIYILFKKCSRECLRYFSGILLCLDKIYIYKKVDRIFVCCIRIRKFTVQIRCICC